MSLPFRVNMTATDPVEAHEWLSRSYMPYGFRFSDADGQFHARHASVEFDGFSASIIDHYAVRAELDAVPTRDFVLIAQPLTGQYSVTTADNHIIANPGECFVLDPDAAVRILQKDMRLSVIRLDRAALERVAAELIGEAVPGSLRFPLARPLSAERGRRWQELIQHLVREMPLEGDCSVIPMARTTSLRLAAATLLETFPNSAIRADPRSVGHTHERALRRAISFIEDNADADIDVPQIAEAARLSPRELHLAFRIQRCTTPLAYLDRVRLECAHRDLRENAANNGVTVADIAARWGFVHAGRFAAEYRKRFGLPPSQTLHALSRSGGDQMMGRSVHA